jgi:23S rRNA (guanosine2251-2'-O)-methyltransferase
MDRTVTKRTDILFGYHPVMEALRAGRRRIHTIFCTKEKSSPRRDDLLRLAEQRALPLRWTDAQQLSAMAGTPHHQGVCAETGPYPLSSLEEILIAAARQGEEPLLVVLDQLVDPQNVGAIVRTAQCVGVHGVITAKDRSAPPTAGVSKASAGALEHIRLARVTNLVSTFNMLKKKGLWIAGAGRDGSVELFKSDLSGPLVLVMGAEEKGLRPLVRQHCDFTIAIPQSGPIGSLNASVAAGIILYDIFRQRVRRSPSARTP